MWDLEIFDIFGLCHRGHQFFTNTSCLLASLQFTELVCHNFDKEKTLTLKYLLRYWPIFALSSTLHFVGAVNTRQNMTVYINNLVPSEFPNRSSRSAMSLISTFICI